MPDKRLVLLRHAKSSWAQPDLADHDRPLNDRGRRAAAAVGHYLRRAGVRPDLVLCSSAIRARQTLESLDLANSVEIRIEPDLYGASAGDLLSRIRKVPARVVSLLLIAHNPGIELLARSLTGDGLSDAEKFPTGAVAEFVVSVSEWEEIGPGSVRLHAFVVPRDLV